VCIGASKKWLPKGGKIEAIREGELGVPKQKHLSQQTEKKEADWPIDKKGRHLKKNTKSDEGIA